MKAICILLFFLFMLDGYCQDKSAPIFTYTLSEAEDRYFVKPDFENFSVDGKEQVFFSIRDRDYFRKAYYGIIKASIPQQSLLSMTSAGNVRSTVSLYVDSKGKIFYIYFALLKKDIQFLTDQHLNELYRNLKNWQIDMSKMEIIPEHASWRQNRDEANTNTDTINYSRIRLPFILYDNSSRFDTFYSLLAGKPKTPPNYQDLAIPIQPINGGSLFWSLPFPAMTWKTIDGDTIKTASLKGKVVLYNFYDPNDPLCVAETKGLNHLYKKYRKKDVVFVSVALAADDVIRTFHAKYRSGFKAVVWDEENLDQLPQMIRKFPTNVVVDVNGEILLVRTGGLNNPNQMKQRMAVDISPVIRSELARIKALKVMPEESN